MDMYTGGKNDMFVNIYLRNFWKQMYGLDKSDKQNQKCSNSWIILLLWWNKCLCYLLVYT